MIDAVSHFTENLVNFPHGALCTGLGYAPRWPTPNLQEVAMVDRSIRALIEDKECPTCPENMTVGEAARLMQRHHIGAIMVVENERLIGIFTERDALFRVLAEDRNQSTPVGDVMTRNPVSISPDKQFADALQLMHTGRFRHVPVVENGRAVGLVSASDAMGPELEAFIWEVLRQEQASDVLA
jgi:CBS domain-containing protein